MQSDNNAVLALLREFPFFGHRIPFVPRRTIAAYVTPVDATASRHSVDFAATISASAAALWDAGWRVVFCHFCFLCFRSTRVSHSLIVGGKHPDRRSGFAGIAPARQWALGFDCKSVATHDKASSGSDRTDQVI